VYKRNYVKARVSGATTAQAALAAGVSARQGTKYETEADVQAAYRQLVRAAVPEAELVALLRGGCYATTRQYSADGKRSVEVADWRVRRPYIEMAAEHGGLVTPGARSAVAGIVIEVQHIGEQQHSASASASASALGGGTGESTTKQLSTSTSGATVLEATAKAKPATKVM
jgi:hypothetical protein